MQPIIRKKEAKTKEKKKKRKETVRAEGSDDEDDEEKERLKDLQDRDAFAKRLLEKDKSKTRNVATANDKKSFERAAKRLKLEQVSE